MNPAMAPDMGASWKLWLDPFTPKDHTVPAQRPFQVRYCASALPVESWTVLLGLIMMGLVWTKMGPPPAEPQDVTCEVAIRGLPRSALASHVLQVDDRTLRLDGVRVAFRIRTAHADVRLRGPRYRARLALERERCGKTPILLHVEALPAALVFDCPPKDLSIRCLNCPAPLRGRFYTPTSFPQLRVEDVAGVLELELRAVGFRRKRLQIRLLPGPNTIHPRMQPL